MFPYQPQQQQSINSSFGSSTMFNSSNPSFSGNVASSFTGSNQQIQPSRTLFLGDLSIYCTERDICQVFASFGPIESIHLKRVPQGTSSHLSFGFVRYKHRLSAETALASMQGAIFLGRPLRIGWAEDTRNLNPVMPMQAMAPKRPLVMMPPTAVIPPPVNTTVPNAMPMPPPPAQPPHAQIHVTFVSNHLKIVTEGFLRNIFERFGDILDVSIKKLHVNKDNGQQSGYGFIHYALDDLGVAAALRAVDTVNESTIESIYFRCSMSHGLAKYVRDRGIQFSRPTRAGQFDGHPSVDRMIHSNPNDVSRQPFEKKHQGGLIPSSMFSSNFHQESSYGHYDQTGVNPHQTHAFNNKETFNFSSGGNGISLLNQHSKPVSDAPRSLSALPPFSSYENSSFLKLNSTYEGAVPLALTPTFSNASTGTTSATNLSLASTLENDLSQSIIDQLWAKY